MKHLLLKGAALASLMTLAAPAQAVTYVYVGSWQPYNNNAPVWFGSPPNGPLAYTGREAAALIFGGPASRYRISTAGVDPALINFSAWYDVIGVGGHVFADDYSNKYLGSFYGPTSGYNCCGNRFVNTNAASAFIRDNFVTGTNYAFAIVGGAVPEPASWAMLIAGFGVMGGALRRRAAVRTTVRYA